MIYLFNMKKYLINLLKKLFTKTQFIVCSRNLINNDRNSLYWRIAKKYNLKKICDENPGIIIQGEQGNTNVQGNKYGISEPTLWVFNVIDSNKNYHYNWEEIKLFCSKNDLMVVPELYSNVELQSLGSTVNELVEFSKGKSRINPKIEREGIVVRCIENGKKIFSFKIINPNFLLKFND